MIIIKKATNNSYWRGWEEKATLVYCRWEHKLLQSKWKIVWKKLKKFKIVLPYDPAFPLLGIFLNKTLIQKNICTPRFISAVIFIIGNMKRQPKCPSMDEWTRKKQACTQWNTATSRKSQTSPFVTTWMGLEDIMLSEISHTDEQMPYAFSYKWN